MRLGDGIGRAPFRRPEGHGAECQRADDQAGAAEAAAPVREPANSLAARPDVPHLCDVSSHVEDYFRMLAGEAEEAVLDVLGQRTLDQSLRELLALKNKAHTRSDRETRAVVRAKH